MHFYAKLNLPYFQAIGHIKMNYFIHLPEVGGE